MKVEDKRARLALATTQAAFFVGYAFCVLLWAISEYLVRTRPAQERAEPKDDVEQKPLLHTDGAGAADAAKAEAPPSPVKGGPGGSKSLVTRAANSAFVRSGSCRA